MHPEILGYPAFLVVVPFAVAIGLVPFLWGARREGVLSGRLLLAITLVLGAGLAGGKLYSIVERGETASFDFELSNGFRYPGAILGVAMSLPLLSKILPTGVSVAGLLDLLAPSFGFAMAAVRTHCLLSGCCAGSTCDYGWCITFPSGSPPFQHQMIAGVVLPSAAASLPVHPLQIYFMFSSLAAALVALWFGRRSQYAGQTFLVFLLVHETGKFLLEYLRFPRAPFVQAGSLVLGAVALLLLVFGQWRLAAREPVMSSGSRAR